LIGNFGWTHVGRSLDGFHYTAAKKVNVQVVGAIPTRGVFQVDGWGQLDVGLLYASANGFTNKGSHSSDWRVFGSYYQDWRKVLKTDNRSMAMRQGDTGNIRIGSFGGHYLHSTDTKVGTFDAMVWGVAQTGRWGRLDHRAGAIDVEAGWQPPVLPQVKPWIRAGYFRSTGDGNPNDTEHGTFFQMLPTPRPFARFPFFNLMNNTDVFGMVTLRPHKSVTLKSEVHSLRLTEANDLWLLGGGAFQPWTFGYIGRVSNGHSGLATLYDISADWMVSAHFALAGYYGYANGKDVMRSIYPQGKNGSLGYLELTFRF
jgi:hypothetical protein